MRRSGCWPSYTVTVPAPHFPVTVLRYNNDRAGIESDAWANARESSDLFRTDGRRVSFLAQRAVPRRYSAGEIVFGEGEPCSGLYVVESGHVRIFKSSANGREQVLSIDGPGSSIAELPVFDGGSYPASVTAIEDATLLFVSKQDFQALCLAHPQVALKVLRVVGARLRRLVGIIEELSFTTVRHRLASFLLRLAQKEGKRSDAGVEILRPPAIRNWHRILARSASWFPAIFPGCRLRGCFKSMGGP